MVFVEYILEQETQNVRMYYEGPNGENICFIMMFHYRTFSTNTDIEDVILEEQELFVENNLIRVQQIDIKGSNEERWRVEFSYADVQYFIEINGIKEVEIEKIVKNLYFF